MVIFFSFLNYIFLSDATSIIMPSQALSRSRISWYKSSNKEWWLRSQSVCIRYTINMVIHQSLKLSFRLSCLRSGSIYVAAKRLVSWQVNGDLRWHFFTFPYSYKISSFTVRYIIIYIYNKKPYVGISKNGAGPTSMKPEATQTQPIAVTYFGFILGRSHIQPQTGADAA